MLAFISVFQNLEQKYMTHKIENNDHSLKKFFERKALEIIKFELSNCRMNNGILNTDPSTIITHT